MDAVDRRNAIHGPRLTVYLDPYTLCANGELAVNVKRVITPRKAVDRQLMSPMVLGLDTVRVLNKWPISPQMFAHWRGNLLSKFGSAGRWIDEHVPW